MAFVRDTPVDYRLIATFVAVAEEASFSKAAHRLGVAKGTVSRAISDLERCVGTELIHRNTHSVALSTAGAALYERTARHLEGLDEALENLPERSSEPSGLLRLTASRDVGLVALPPLLFQFARRYPDIAYDLRITNTKLNIVAEGIDVAIRFISKPMNDSTLMVRRVGSLSGSFYAAPSYLARRGVPRLLGEADHDWIVHPVVADESKLKASTIKYLVDDFLVIRNLLCEGAGVGKLPNFVAAPCLLDGRLESVPIVAPYQKPTCVLLYPFRSQQPKKVTAFCNFVIDWFKQRPL